MTSPVAFAPWIVCRKPSPAARLRLFCFPYAGAGSAAFRTWPDELPAEIEVCVVQLPGRESRLREAPFTRLEPLVRQLADALAPHLHRPFSFLGYSLGTLIGFELARLLRRRKAPFPVHLLVAARAAPQIPLGGKAMHQLPDDLLVAEVCRRYDGIPQVILQEAELLKLFLAIVRADLAVMETYTYPDDEPLDCPISAFGGLDDPTVSRADLEAWREQTRGPFTLRLLPGNHFFLNTAREQFLEGVVRELRPHLA
jgi:surfactin synthase thioesterase subunit